MNRILATLGAVLLFCVSAQAATIGEQRSLVGVIETIHVDAAPPYFLHRLKTADGEIIDLDFQGRSAPRSGAAVRVRGRSDEHRRFRIEDLDVILAAPPAVTMGEQRVLTLMVNFQDAPQEPWTAAQVKGSCEGTPNNFYDESSDAQTWFICETYGWFTLPLNAADCQIGLVSQMADAAALTAGHDPAQYGRIAYVTAGAASTSCISASTGGASADGYSKTWMINQTHWTTWTHELGHALGLYHAHALECGSTAILCEPVYGGSHVEYGYYGDIMGTGVGGGMNIFSREYLRWLAASVAPASGSYVLTPIELPNAQGLKVLKSVDPATGARTYYYVEYRQCIGFDAGLCNITAGNYKDGVVIATGVEGGDFAFVGGGNDNYQLDMAPQTTGQWDGALTAGRCFSDGNVAISLLWEDGTWAAVAVDLAGNCQAEPPLPPSNSPPIANSDSATMPWKSTAPITIPVLVNDRDPDGDPLTIIPGSVTQGNKGTTAIVTSGIRYTPNKPMRGSDSFSYTISDGRGGTASAGVTVTAVH